MSSLPLSTLPSSSYFSLLPFPHLFAARRLHMSARNKTGIGCRLKGLADPYRRAPAAAGARQESDYELPLMPGTQQRWDKAFLIPALRSLPPRFTAAL
jgi:hypothetical protein